MEVNSINTSSFSYFIAYKEIGNETHVMMAIKRSVADFIPLLPIGGTAGTKAGLIDYMIKVISGVLVFGLLAIALRRRFERKFRH